MILYHGSNVEVIDIDLSKCKPYKDFGQGFYLTPIKSQAIAMARRISAIYDIVFGPVADDTLVNLIRQYNDNLIDLEALVKKMEYRKLSLQYSFHTPKGISYLKRI